jgi:hypothetical protein
VKPYHFRWILNRRQVAPSGSALITETLDSCPNTSRCVGVSNLSKIEMFFVDLSSLQEWTLFSNLPTLNDPPAGCPPRV